jgi:hypothetical protein
MRTIDEEFHTLVNGRSLEDDAVEQLTHAARALARMKPWVATSITCTRSVPTSQLLEFAGLAYRLAAEHGLAVQVEPGDPACVRFFRHKEVRSGGNGQRTSRGGLRRRLESRFGSGHRRS